MSFDDAYRASQLRAEAFNAERSAELAAVKLNRVSKMSNEAYRRGYDDELNGVGWLNNPFPDSTTEARRWVDGKVQAIVDARKQNDS